MKCLVFGAGYFGRNYIRELSHNVVAVIEPDKLAAEFVKNAYNVPVYPDVPTHLNFDAAVIVTPPDSHIQIAKGFLADGHYVLIEKPFATSVEEALQLHKWRQRCMAGMIYLYHPAIEHLKTQVAKVPLNHAYSQRTNDGPVREWQNAMWDLAAHDVSIFNYVLGQTPHYVDAMGTPTRDWAVLRMTYVTVETVTYVSWRGGPKVRRVELVPQESGDRIIFDDLKAALEISPMRRMLDAFMSGEWDERCSYEAGLEVINVLEKAQRMLPR